jgi:hypothetical protein
LFLARWRLPVLTLALAIAAAAGAARADPGYYVVTPYDNAGLVTLDLRYWSTHPRHGQRMVWPEFGIGYGVNSRWTTELFESWIGPSLGNVGRSTLNWQNQVLLTQGEWPADLALHLQWVQDRSGTRQHALEFGPLLQTDLGRTQLNANLIFERGRGAASARPTQLKYQWQLRHRWRPGLHLGAQGFGELGPWDDWRPAAQQSHRAGPAAFFTWRDGERPSYHLQAALLSGRTYGQSGRMLTLRAHVEF